MMLKYKYDDDNGVCEEIPKLVRLSFIKYVFDRDLDLEDSVDKFVYNLLCCDFMAIMRSFHFFVATDSSILTKYYFYLKSWMPFCLYKSVDKVNYHLDLDMNVRINSDSVYWPLSWKETLEEVDPLGLFKESNKQEFIERKDQPVLCSSCGNKVGRLETREQQVFYYE